LKNIDKIAEGVQLTTIMEFSDSDSESKIEDSSVSFLEAPIRVEPDTSTCKGSIESTKRKPVDMSCKELISLLSSKERFPPLADAFDKKHVNVAWVDLSHSQYSYLLPSSSGKMDISKSFSKIIEMGEKGKHLVVLYTKSSNKKRPINSLAYLERKKLELVYRNIDKIDEIYSRCPKPLDFYDLANVINTVNLDSFLLKS
jgi:hypothetical protein